MKKESEEEAAIVVNFRLKIGRRRGGSSFTRITNHRVGSGKWVEIRPIFVFWPKMPRGPVKITMLLNERNTNFIVRREGFI